MATWNAISADVFKEIWTNTAGTEWKPISGKVWVELLYNADTITPKKVDLKFKFKSEGNDNFYDTYYILFNPTDSSKRKVIALKPRYTAPYATSWSNYAKPAWPYESKSFEITKKYNEEKFTIPAFWFCNDGDGKSEPLAEGATYNAAEFYNRYKEDGGGRKLFKSTHTTKAISIAAGKSVATNGKSPTIYLTDNKDNTVTISGKLGASGTNNELTGAKLYYTVDGTDPSSSSSRKSLTIAATAESNYNKTISITAACTVKAYVLCEYKYNNTHASSTINVVYYAAPKNPGKPALTSNSFRNGRLTIKQNWTYSWTAAPAANTNSPVKGYRIRLYKNGKLVTGLTNGSNNIISKGTGANEYLDRESTSCTITFNPVDFGFKAGDTVQLGIFAYTRNGKNTQLWSGDGKTQVLSDVATVQNAGVVNVKVGNAWKEGQVYVKVSGAWKEAETVNVKVNGSWKESQ